MTPCVEWETDAQSAPSVTPSPIRKRGVPSQTNLVSEPCEDCRMSRETDGPDLLSIVHDIATASSPETAAIALLVGCVNHTGADRGRLYLLDLANSEYRSYAQFRRSATATPVAAPPREASLASLPPIERAVLTGKPQIMSKPSSAPGRERMIYASRAIFPILRGKACLGLLDLDSDQPGHFRSDNRTLTEGIVSLLSLVTLVYDWRSRIRLIKEAQQPIRNDQAENEFNEQVVALAALASQMEYVALHELGDDGVLYGMADIGFSGGEQTSLDALHPKRYEPFSKVIATRRPYTAGDIDDTRQGGLEDLLIFDRVSSMVVCPVFIGEELFGTLTFCSSLPYDYTSDEVLGFQNIANGIGVAIANYRNFQSTMLSIAEYQQVGTAITAQAVAQAARHEARGIIDDATTVLVTLRQRSKQTKPKLWENLALIDDVDRCLEDLQRVLDKIKASSNPPSENKTLVSIYSLWEQAKSQMLGKLNSARVTVAKYEGPDDIYIRVAPDWFRQVFINLLLNSTDAFSTDSVPRRNRQIRLIVEQPSERALDIEMTYMDNAGGINFVSLRSMDGKPIDSPPEQAIFSPSVTSKPDGSGWGLALARRILRDHGGSIDLRDRRGGVSFKLTVPKPQGK
jgi:signal transduction histidine kinase